jgi:hypothetical protein
MEEDGFSLSKLFATNPYWRHDWILRSDASIRKCFLSWTIAKLREHGVFTSPVMPAPELCVDTTLQSPRESAVQIAVGLELPFSGKDAK